ncbi:uncharacterized protein A4U43_C09F4510 [Asparagus officinalis]|uniref:Uncharacterized protein n=1 Tax=Asparagus officinalis TaxID=4686 RepID=A0A5P1E731_ASPOF|nr:uncharacterized protein A4U43_C09F4510 [Asparagus officinalis]
MLHHRDSYIWRRIICQSGKSSSSDQSIGSAGDLEEGEGGNLNGSGSMNFVRRLAAVQGGAAVLGVSGSVAKLGRWRGAAGGAAGEVRERWNRRRLWRAEEGVVQGAEAEVMVLMVLEAGR